MDTNTVTKYTPGPWKFLYDETPETVQPLNVNNEAGEKWVVMNICIGNSEGQQFAEVRAYTTKGFLQDFDQWMANAKLIKSAPELLEALKEILHFKYEIGAFKMWNLTRAIELGEAAIKKATT